MGFLSFTIKRSMQNFITIIAVFLICVVVFAACAVSPKQIAELSQAKGGDNIKPAWVWNPSMDGKIGGVGSCGMHVNGLTGQRELAIQRAIDEIARQMGVRVSNAKHMETTGTRDSAVTRVDSYSIQTVDGATVKAEVKEYWEDKRTGELHVWMVVQ